MNTPDISGVSEGIAQSVKENLEEERAKEESVASCTIGISISESTDTDALGFTNLHVQDAMVEITRYLLVNNCKLIYGGDLRRGGYTFIFSELAKLYSKPENYHSFRIANYFAWPIHLNMLRSDDSEFKANNIQIEKLPLPDGIDVDPAIFIKPDTIPHKIIWAKSLSNMRKIITENSQARVIMGGQIKNYMGKIPGVVEEAILSVRQKKPVYICGAFGGGAKTIVEAICQGKSHSLSDEFQNQDAEYFNFQTEWNKTEVDKISFEQINKEFSDLGIKGLSDANGLSEVDNMRLFGTPHITEMVYLILKGLKAKKII